MENHLPPYGKLLDLSVEEQGEELVFTMPFTEKTMGRPGFLHGGAIAGLLEFAAFGTLGRALGDEKIVTKPISVTVDYMRGGTHRPTHATAVIERLGRRIANVEAFAWQQGREKPIASARINFLLDRG